MYRTQQTDSSMCRTGRENGGYRRLKLFCNFDLQYLRNQSVPKNGPVQKNLCNDGENTWFSASLRAFLTLCILIYNETLR